MAVSFHQVINYPLQTASNNFNRALAQGDMWRVAGWYPAGAFALMINISLNPLAIVVDLIHGLSILLLSQPLSSAAKKDVQNLLLVSPLQQLVTAGIYRIPLIMFGPLTLICWPFLKNAAEASINRFPPSLRPSGFSIFYHVSTQDDFRIGVFQVLRL